MKNHPPNDQYSTKPEVWPAPVQQMETPQPDPYSPQQLLTDSGYLAPDLFPISTDFALELMERDVPVYMLHSNHTKTLALDSEDLAMHIGHFVVTRADCEAVRNRPDILALREQFLADYRKDMGIVPPENHLKAAELSLEDDYGMIDGIINNGKKPALLAQLKPPHQEHHPQKNPQKGNEEHDL